MPTQVLYGPRLGKEGKFLLTRRADNGQWCLPSGGLEPGESVEEACIREVFEETGLNVGIKRLIGVYSNRDQLVIYDDGARFQIVALHFEAEITGGVLGLSNETTDFGYFSLDEIKEIDLIHSHRDRIQDSQNQISTIVK